LAERLRQARAGFDLILEVDHHPRKARIAMAARDDVERLQQRHAGLQHRRKLPREERHVLVADRAAAAIRLTLDLEDADALPPEVRRGDRLRHGAQFAAQRLVVAVDTLPDERLFAGPDIPARYGCGRSG